MKTTVDWLTVRTKGEPRGALESFRAMFGDTGSFLALKPLERGIRGFSQASEIVLGGMAVGRMDYGGEHQRDWVRTSITGKGCEWVEDWDAYQNVQALESAQIRRLDIALTTWEGEITHDTVVSAHAAGRFAGGGRPPAMRQIISTDPRAGRTCYVGRRESSKFFRAYEKGHEMAGKCRDAIVHEINGHLVEGIYRCELELKADEITPLPWDVIPRRDSIFAGSYPFCADMLPGVQADTLERRKARAPQTALEQALNNLRIQFGPTLFTAQAAYGGDISAVWGKIIGKKHNEALVSAGVLEVEH